MSDIEHIDDTQVDKEPQKRGRRKKSEVAESVIEQPTVDATPSDTVTSNTNTPDTITMDTTTMNKTIIVGRRETWLKLARRYGVSEEALIEKNSGGPLYAGRTIRI